MIAFLERSRWGIASALMIGSFALYLHTMGPTLVPYRDAGEMATTVPRLGILHPPGYPAYTLIGKLATRVPLANPAYRLNLLSAVAMALAWGVLFLLAAQLWGTAAAVLMVLLGMVSWQFWMHALVPEMNTLNILILSSLLWLLYRQKFNAAAFLFGVGLGVRMDLVLCAPALGVLFFSGMSQDKKVSQGLKWLGWFFLGYSVFFYLWIRSNGQPVPNWGDPSTLERLLASVTRRSYASTLDLLSKSYGMGENFWPEWRLYLRHLARDFSLLSFPLASWGLWRLWRYQRSWWWVLSVGFIFTGPLFIFLGNLPVNPHAVAIMQAAYLVPDLFFLLMVGAGMAGLASVRWVLIAGGGLLCMVTVAQAARFFPVISKRVNFTAVDFARNAFYTVPEPSLIIARSDVPVFSLFYGHWIHSGFKWRVPIAQGLAGSAWYHVMMNRENKELQIEKLQTAEDWDALAKAHPGWSIFGTQDVNWPENLYPRMVSSGLLMQYLPRGKSTLIASDVRLSELGIYRGRYRYDAYYEYFTPELIEEYAKAWMEWGKLLARSVQADAGIEPFMQALNLKPDMPYPAFQLGYIYFTRNQFDQADFYYRWSVENFRKMSRQAEEWKSAAPIRLALQRDYAQAMAHWGVVQERLGYPDKAETLYHRALEIDPTSADARYNLAVIYWRMQRWQDVVNQLQALSAAHPEDSRWRVYLPKALEKLKK